MTNAPDQQRLRNPSASEIPALLTELSASGQSVAAFARSRGLKPHNLYVARRRNRDKSAPPLRFDPVQIVGGDMPASAFRLELTNGTRLWVPADFESSAVRRLVELLTAC